MRCASQAYYIHLTTQFPTFWSIARYKSLRQHSVQLVGSSTPAIPDIQLPNYSVHNLPTADAALPTAVAVRAVFARCRTKFFQRDFAGLIWLLQIAN